MADPAPGSPVATPPAHRPFGVVLAGGGARGAAHAGVLRALEHDGLHPAAVVGVSMGAIVGAAYALNPDWYRAYVDLELAEIPGLGPGTAAERTSRLRAVLSSTRSLRHLLLRWGPLTIARPTMEAFLERLTLGRRIEEARVPFAAVATDLTTGLRVVLDRGSAAEAAYASSALAGALPPAERDGSLLADGCYADVAPVDVARALGAEVVIVVNPNAGPAAANPRNGLQAIMRAMEIAVGHHALERFREADLELRVPMALPVVTTDFSHHRDCVAAGVRAVRAHRSELAVLLRPRRDRDAWTRRRQPRVARERDGHRVPV